MERKKALKPVKRQRLHEAVAARLEEMILNGEFQPGEPLPTEHEMATQLEVSRTVVRDAMRVLATKGLVDIRHGVGTFVTHSGRERLAEALALSLRRGDYTPDELYVIRRGLELIVVEQAIEKATDEQVAAMRRVLAHYRDRLQAEPGAAHIDEHTHFHQLMVRSTGNRVLMDLLDPITVFRIPYNLGTADVQPADASDQEAFIQKHEKVVDAIERRDLDAARAAMLEHLGDLEQRAHRATDELRRSEEP